MDWENVRFLLALARAGSLAGAARALRVRHTTVRRRVARLESDLRTRLVVRARDGLRLTDAARRVIARAEEMEHAAAAIAGGAGDERLEGPLRVTCSEAVGALFLAAELARFAARHPGIVIDLVTEARPLSLARGEADLAVRLARPTEATSVARRAGVLAFAAYATRPPDDAPPLLVYDDGVATQQTEWLLRRHRGGRVALRSNSSGVLAAAAAAGAGVAVLPCLVGDATPRLRRLAEPHEAPAPEVWLVAHRELRAVARVAAAWDHLLAAFDADSAFQRRRV